MAIDYGKGSGLAFPKGRNKALDKQDQKAALEAHDKKENTKAKKRAGGRCEVVDWHSFKDTDGVGVVIESRCQRSDTQTHHLIGGIGRRNKGKSILAQWKLRVCQECHQAITANILRPTTADHDAHTVRYWRAR